MRVRLAFAVVSLCFSVVVNTQESPAPPQIIHRPDANTIVDPRDYQDLQWRNVGPTRGGRVTAIAGVRRQPCTFYMGGTGGGVFKTETCGERWVPISDGQLADGSIGSIDVSESSPDVVYVGTGSAAIRSNVIIGRGVYKSVDAGRTWRFLALKESGQIGALKVHPSNPDIAWLAALGSPYGPNQERGIFKTTDGGTTWRKVLFVNSETGGRALAINMSNPDEIYAGMYKGFRKGWDIVSGGPASEGGIYKSTDGGEHWTHLTSGLPQNLIGKIDLDVARSQPRTVYAMIEAPGREGGLYRSDDSGATWKNVNASDNLRARPFYFNYVDVNPKNPEEVWVNALGLFKSTDGGRTFETVQAPHGDMHGMWFNPDNPSIAIQCNDGGATITTDGGRSWSSILNQPTAEIYMVSVDNQYPYRLYGPQQDNTTFVVPSLPPHSWAWDTPAQAWTQASGCETGGIWPRPDGTVIWGACKGEVERYSTLTGQSQGTWIYPQNRYGQDPDNIRYRFPRSTVIYLSPHNPNVIYQASHVLHRSTDEGATWQVISPDLTAHEPELQVVPGRPITRDVTGEEVYSSIYAMVESRLEPGVIWVGANDGPVSVTRDNGRTWKRVTPKDLPPGGRVQNIEDSPHRKGSAYLAVYRYLREHDLQPYIYMTNDYGETWTRLTDGTNGIPNDFPTRVVREDPDREGLLYAGTEFGAFVSFDNGRHWQSLQQNLPATPVTDIRVHRKDLVISTMGRSFWIMDDVSPLEQLGPASKPVRGDGGPGPELLQPRDTIRYRYTTGRGSIGIPQYPPIAATIDYLLPQGFNGDLTLEILNPAGTVVRIEHSADANAGGRGNATRGEGQEGATEQGEPESPALEGGPGRGGTRALSTRTGHNRYQWDYRFSNNGPMVAPGRYTVRMTSNGTTQSKSFNVAVDPRVMKDGVTQADLVAQQQFLLKVYGAIGQARLLEKRINRAMGLSRVPKPAAPGIGVSPEGLQYSSPLQRLWARVVTADGPYPEPMLIDQLRNIVRMVAGADQKVGQEAVRRFDDLLKELTAIETELKPLEPR